LFKKSSTFAKKIQTHFIFARMNLYFSIQPSEKLALRNPESTELGKKIVRQGLILMNELGYEHFTFKKLAEAIDTTEASVYRYFENKHRLLLYLLTWYWNVLEYSVLVSLKNLNDPEMKINRVIEILVNKLPEWVDAGGFDKAALHSVAVSESSKAYLIKEVDEINKEHLFKPYKDLCNTISQLFVTYNPNFPYPRSLASTVVEMSQFQPYFAEHLPSLTDINKESDIENGVNDFLKRLIFNTLNQNK
jgi:AcrR family transcriptional regulator